MINSCTIKEAYERGKNTLSLAGLESPAFDALCLLDMAFGIGDRAALAVHGNETAAPEKKELFDELIIRREIQENGKSRARVNGAVVALPDLQRLGEELIQMHGQSEQLLLRDIRTHTQMLDDFAGNGELLAEYTSEWATWNKIQDEIKATEERAKNLAAQKDFLKFQFDELSKAALKEGEEEALEEKVNSASKQEAETRYLNDIQGMLGGENGLLDQVQI